MDQEFSYLKPPPQAQQVEHDLFYIKHGEKEKHCRKIFEGVQYDQYEVEKIKELEAEIQKKNIKLPDNWTQSDTLKIVYNSKFKIKDAIPRLQDHLAWRANAQFHNPNPEMIEFISQGLLYTFGRDYQFRPVIYLYTYLIDQKKYNKDFMIMVLSFFLGFVKKSMLLPGKVENWVFVVETNSQGVFSAPSGLGDIIKTMALNFAGCLHKMVVLNPSTGLNLMWSGASAVMDDDAKAKNKFITKKHLDQLKEIIPPTQLEKKFGGQLENCNKFWPPQIIQ